MDLKETIDKITKILVDGQKEMNVRANRKAKKKKKTKKQL